MIKPIERIERLSISQLKAFQRNPFYWALSYAYQIPQPETEALTYGKTLHSAIESILLNDCNTSDSIDASIWMKALEVVSVLFNEFALDQYKIEVEKEFFITLDSEIPPYKGIIDIFIEDFEEGKPAILDHKTIGKAKYALNEKKLKEDLQLSLYAHFAGSKNGVHVQHNQIFKDSEKIKIVSVKLDKEIIDKNISIIIELSKELLSFFEKLKAHGLYSSEVAAYRKCDRCKFMYGGCAYHAICENKISIDEYIASLTEVNPMSDASPKWLIPPAEAADLSQMMAQARAFFEPKIQNKFDLRDEIAKSIVEGLKKHDVKQIYISQFLLNGGDPDYQPVLSRIREYGAKIFVEVK